MANNKEKETNINLKVEIEQKPQRVEVFQKEYFKGKKPLSLLKLYGILFFVFIFLALSAYIICSN